MASYDVELLSAARSLLDKPQGRRGKLSRARTRRAISTAYYALFNFLIEEVGLQIVGTRNELTTRKRILARSLTHAGMKVAAERVREPRIVDGFERYFGVSVAPLFARDLARTFVDAQSKRHNADYDLNEPVAEAEASALIDRIAVDVASWRGANAIADRDFKQAFCLLLLLRGQLRADKH